MYAHRGEQSLGRKTIISQIVIPNSKRKYAVVNEKKNLNRNKEAKSTKSKLGVETKPIFFLFLSFDKKLLILNYTNIPIA